MSMHNIPLTPLEEEGLRSHGLSVGTPSQLSDCFRHGVSWGVNASQLEFARDTRAWMETAARVHQEQQEKIAAIEQELALARDLPKKKELVYVVGQWDVRTRSVVYHKVVSSKKAGDTWIEAVNLPNVQGRSRPVVMAVHCVRLHGVWYRVNATRLPYIIQEHLGKS